jgi:hypothetical protein
MKQGLFIVAALLLALVVRRVVKAAMPFFGCRQVDYLACDGGYYGDNG